jgi:RNA polymerase sigma-70 factor (ECF subfamily)
MPQRCVTVLHVLPIRSLGRGSQLLLYPHSRWFTPETGRPCLALPTKKVRNFSKEPSTFDHALEQTLAAVLREDLGSVVENPVVQRGLPSSTLQMLSPTRREPTTYTIVPVPVWIDPRYHEALRARVQGKWLSAGQALRQPSLSPTARCLLERADVLGLAKTASQEIAADEWTRRLLDALRGDRGSFGQLLEDMKPWLISRLRACSLTNGLFLIPEDVEDALQDAAVNALSHLDRFDPGQGTAGGWLWVITRNCAVTLLRRRTVRRATSLLPEDGRPGCAVPAVECDPAMLAERREEVRAARRRLERALATVDRKVRRAWELRFVHGKPYAEIARELRQPLGTIATWIFRLKKAI